MINGLGGISDTLKLSKVDYTPINTRTSMFSKHWLVDAAFGRVGSTNDKSNIAR